MGECVGQGDSALAFFGEVASMLFDIDFETADSANSVERLAPEFKQTIQDGVRLCVRAVCAEPTPFMIMSIACMVRPPPASAHNTAAPSPLPVGPSKLYTPACTTARHLFVAEPGAERVTEWPRSKRADGAVTRVGGMSRS